MKRTASEFNFLLIETRKQHVKIIMYKRLLWLFVISVCSIFVIFIVNWLILIFFDLKTMQQSYWKYKWISLEGLLQILYFVIFLGIIFIWKPTQHNALYGLQQISQDEDEALDLEEQLMLRSKRANFVENEGFELYDILGSTSSSDDDDNQSLA